jgi:hypothetical protein
LVRRSERSSTEAAIRPTLAVPARTARQKSAQDHFEAIIFSEGLNQYRDILEPGRPLVLTIQANLEGEDVRARITTAEPLDQAAARHQKGMRIFAW